jgi:cyanate lyase
VIVSPALRALIEEKFGDGIMSAISLEAENAP